MMARAQEQVDQERVPWSDDEDRRLIEYMQTLQNRGEPVRWTDVPRGAGLTNRTPASCRQRWTNFLRPDIKEGAFSEEEEATIIECWKEYGNKWARIASHVPGRTGIQIKNFCNSRQNKLSKKGNPYSSTSTTTFEGWPELMDSESSDIYCSDDISLHK